MMAEFVTSRITLDMAAIDKLMRAQTVALEQAAEAVHTDVLDEHVVPRRDGDLSGRGFYADISKSGSGHVELVHSTPYARRMYYHPEYNFHKTSWVDSAGRQHDGNSNAQGHWFDPWISGNRANFAKTAFCKIFRKLGGLGK